jgi:hypothetical protein
MVKVDVKSQTRQIFGDGENMLYSNNQISIFNCKGPLCTIKMTS